MQGGLPGDDDEVNEAEHLLSENDDSMEMAGVNAESSRDGNWDQVNRVGTTYTDNPSTAERPSLDAARTAESTMPINGPQETIYRVYKMRWFGLGQLILLNIIVSWDVSRDLLLPKIVPPIFHSADIDRSGSPFRL